VHDHIEEHLRVSKTQKMLEGHQVAGAGDGEKLCQPLNNTEKGRFSRSNVGVQNRESLPG
jgi:hypothetical protein